MTDQTANALPPEPQRPYAEPAIRAHETPNPLLQGVAAIAFWLAMYVPVWLAGQVDNAGTVDGMGVWSAPAAIVVWAIAGHFAGYSWLGWLRLFVPFYNLYWIGVVSWRNAGKAIVKAGH